MKFIQLLEIHSVEDITRGTTGRGVTRALIGGGVYSYIRLLPDEFLLNFFVFKFISKEISWAEHEYMNIHPPPPPQLTL